MKTAGARAARRAALVALAATALGPVPAAGQPAPAAASSPMAAVVVVEIRDYRFHPGTLTVAPGTTVRWVNAEKRTTHTVRFVGPDGIESDRLFPGDSYERRFDQPGRFAYTCGPHPEMTGQVDVRP